MNAVWVEIAQDTFRLRVRRGYLYRYGGWGQHPVSMVFVPDADVVEVRKVM